MSGLNVNIEVINQKGSPALYADALANRPAAGFVGRIFIDTNNPSTGMYRDTGTNWISVSGGGGGTQTLQTTCDLGNTSTTPVRFGNLNTIPSTAYPLEVAAQNVYSQLAPSSVKEAIAATAIVEYNTNLPAISSGFAYGSIVGSWEHRAILNTANVTVPNGVSSWGGIYSINTFNLIGTTYTQNQAAGIRASSGIKTFINFPTTGIVTHVAGLWSGGLYAPSSTPLVNNYFGLLISNATEVYGGTVNNRFGIYQEGALDNNILVGSTVIGSVTLVPGYKLTVSNGGLQVTGAGTTSTTKGLNVLNSSGTTGFTVLDNGNCGVRESAPTARMHIATGGATTAAVGLKVRNSADTVDILSTFGTTQVLINNTSGQLQTSAQLQIDSQTRGFLPPRMTKAQVLAIVNPVPGLMAYATDVEHLCYYNPTGGWQKVSSAPL
jgi:hypothetical protein